MSPAKKGKSKTLTEDEVKGVFLNMGARSIAIGSHAKEGGTDM